MEQHSLSGLKREAALGKDGGEVPERQTTRKQVWSHDAGSYVKDILGIPLKLHGEQRS